MNKNEYRQCEQIIREAFQDPDKIKISSFLSSNKDERYQEMGGEAACKLASVFDLELSSSDAEKLWDAILRGFRQSPCFFINGIVCISPISLEDCCETAWKIAKRYDLQVQCFPGRKSVILSFSRSNKIGL